MPTEGLAHGGNQTKSKPPHESSKDPSRPSHAKDTMNEKEDTKFAPGKDARGTSSIRVRRTSNNSTSSHKEGGHRRRSSEKSAGGNISRTSHAHSAADDDDDDDAAERPSMEGIFKDTDDDDDNSSDIFDTKDADGEATDPPTPRDSRRTSQSPKPHDSRRRSTGSASGGRSSRRKANPRDGRRASKRQEELSPPSRGRRRTGGPSTGPRSLSQTQHAAKSLVAIGTGGVDSRKPTTRVELKEQGRVREWASFCRRKAYLSLDDLCPGERPRVARKGVVTPFSLQLVKIEGWQVPTVLVERSSATGNSLRFSLSVTFYHAGSKRFYGNSFMGDLLDENDTGRVCVASEKRRGCSPPAKRGGRDRNNKSKARKGRKENGKSRWKGGTGDTDNDEEEEMEVETRHEEMVYWYTGFEDPNCITVVELVATIMDNDNGIQVGQYGCGWTFIQFFGPNEPEAIQHRDVYRGSPRNLLFFQQGDWGSVGETAIPGCSLWFTLSVTESLLKARHLFRPDEIVSAMDVLPGMQTKQIAIPDKPVKVGPFLGLRVKEGQVRHSRRGGNSKGRGRWTILPMRPRLAVCSEFRLSELRVIIPDRGGYERDLLKSLGDDIPDQEIVKTTTHHRTLGFTTTQRQVVTSSTGTGGGKEGNGRRGGGQRAKVVDRRVKIGFHNGHTLVLPHQWVETHLEETDAEDVLMLPEEVSSLSVNGYVAHPLFALVVLIEYTIRTRAINAAGRGVGGRRKKGDPLSKAQAELSHSALPVVVGMQVFLPHDGKRLRLRNTPRDDENMNIGLKLAADKNVRLVTTDLVFTNKHHLLDEAHAGGSDAEDGRGPKMVYFDLKAYDAQGKMLQDETPASGDESPLEASGWEPQKDESVVSSDDSTSSSEDSTSSDSPSPSSSSTTESEPEPSTPPKIAKPRRSRTPTPTKIKRKRPPHRESSSEGSASDSTTPSLVRGDSDGSFIRRPKPASQRNAQVQATEDGWEDWRKSVKVPRRSESLMGQTLQAVLHAEASAQTTVDPEPALGCYGPQAVVVGGFAPLAHDLSRASRTRLSRHGFVDVMKDTIDSYASPGGNGGGLQHQGQIPIDLELEMTDPLAKHEVTLQFAALRAPPKSSRRSSCEENPRHGGEVVIPTSLYFTYQLYTCLATRTERMVLRPDAPRDRLYKAEKGGVSELNILVREGRHGQDEPSLGMRHSIDTTLMQPFEAEAFATYMAGGTLFVDVWDADALMHVGTLAVPLRTLMRQQKGVVKIAMEYEVIADTAAAEDCGSGRGVAIKHGMVGQGPVMCLIQILASNYGEPGQGGDLPAASAVPGTVYPVVHGPNMRSDWRMASGPNGGVSMPGFRGTRPRHKVRARPLSDTNPELSKYMEAVAGPGAGSGGIASLGRRGRGDADADSMGYDELMLLVRRFRGSVKGTVRYSGALLRLLDIPSRKQLEERLVRAIERSERSGLGLAEVFRAMDPHRNGEISTHDLEEMLRGLLLPGELAREHIKALVKSMDPGQTGLVGLRELVTFVRARQGGGSAINAGKTAEAALRRTLARADLGGSSVENVFFSLDKRGKDSLNQAEFWEAVRTLGGIPGVVKADLDFLLRRFDTKGDGRVSLFALMQWAGIKCMSTAGVENAARKKILRAEAASGRHERDASIQEVFAGAEDLASALKAVGSVNLTPREMAASRRRFHFEESDDELHMPNVLQFFGRDAFSSTAPVAEDAVPLETCKREREAQEQLERSVREQEGERAAEAVKGKLKSIVLRAEGMGISLAEVFGVFDKDGSGFITVAELEEGLRELGVFEKVPPEQVRLLVRKLKSVPNDCETITGDGNIDNDGTDTELMVSAEEFVRLVGGEYEATEAAQGRLRKVLTLAEEVEGVTVEDAFSALDKNGTGVISVADLEEGLRQLKVFDGMSRQQASLATKRFDQSGDGSVSLPEFLAFVGKPYAVNDRPLEAKLRRVLVKAESMGTSMVEAFQHFDKDGCGSITVEGFSTGLREMGVFQEFSEEEVQQVVSSFGLDDEGNVSLPKFLRFLGKEYGRRGDVGHGGRSTSGGRGLAGRLRLVLKKAHELGTPLSASFGGFGADESGRLFPQQLHAALRDIGQFRWTTVGEVKSFIRLLQDDGSTMPERGTSVETSAAHQADTSPPEERQLFLSLPALEAFVEGGEEFLDQKEAAALTRRHESRCTSFPFPSKAYSLADDKPGVGSTIEGTGAHGKAVSAIVRVNSWTNIEGLDKGSEGEFDEEKVLLERLRGVLSRAVVDCPSEACSEGDYYNRGGSVRDFLESFDVSGKGLLSKEELVAALRSLGGRGSEFYGRRGIDIVSSRFAEKVSSTVANEGDGGTERDGEGVSIVKLSWWFDDVAERGIREIGNAEASRRQSRRDSNDRGAAASDERRAGSQEFGEKVVSGNNFAGGALREAVRRSEVAKDTTLERTFARLDEDGDGFITLRQLLRGLDQLGVFEQATRDDVFEALDALDAETRSERSALRARQQGESKGEGDKEDRAGKNNARVDLVAFIRLMRQRRTLAVLDGGDGRGDHKQSDSNEEKGEPPYEFSLDPDTRAAEKKLRRVVAKQARLGVDVEGVFRAHDPDQAGSVLRSDFVQAVMRLGVGVLESSSSRRLADATGEVDAVRQRQLGQLARTRGPVERRLLRMRQSRRPLFGGQGRGGRGEAKGNEGNGAVAFEDGDESLALIQWYREGHKKSLVRHILATSLTTEYNLFFAFASPLFFEHPFRNPFNHEERFRIDLDDHQLRVVTGTAEWTYLRRYISPCVGEIGDSPLEAEFFDIDPQRGIQVTLMAHEVVFIPFVFLSLEPLHPAPMPSSRKHHSRGREGGKTSDGNEGLARSEDGFSTSGAGLSERSIVATFVSASHGHVVSVLQVHLHRRAFVVSRTFRFYQNEGEILKRSIQLLPGGEPTPRLSKAGRGCHPGVGGISSNSHGLQGVEEKYVHCVEEAGTNGTGGMEGGIVVEWARRPFLRNGGSAGEGNGSFELQEILVKCRVGRFPKQMGFYLLVRKIYNDHYQGQLYETWHVIVHARLRMDVHSLLGQKSPADLVVRGDRFSRTVMAFSSAPTEVSFEPASAFQLVPGAYNRVELQFRPLLVGSRKVHIHIVDVDSMEIVGAWLATVTAMPPVVTKSYEIDLPLGRACHKRIAYANPWNATRLFRLASSNPEILRPRYESLEVAGGGTGYLRLWFAAPQGVTAKREAFLFVNDNEGQNEECLLIRTRGL